MQQLHSDLSVEQAIEVLREKLSETDSLAHKALSVLASRVPAVEPREGPYTRSTLVDIAGAEGKLPVTYVSASLADVMWAAAEDGVDGDGDMESQLISKLVTDDPNLLVDFTWTVVGAHDGVLVIRVDGSVDMEMLEDVESGGYSDSYGSEEPYEALLEGAVDDDGLTPEQDNPYDVADLNDDIPDDDGVEEDLEDED